MCIAHSFFSSCCTAFLFFQLRGQAHKPYVQCLCHMCRLLQCLNSNLWRAMRYNDHLLIYRNEICSTFLLDVWVTIWSFESVWRIRFGTHKQNSEIHTVYAIFLHHLSTVSQLGMESEWDSHWLKLRQTDCIIHSQRFAFNNSIIRLLQFGLVILQTVCRNPHEHQWNAIVF